MIVFKNGKFLGGDLMDIIQIDWNDSPDSYTWWDNMLYDDVVVLLIPKDGEQIQIFGAYSVELEFIPRQSEDDIPFHSLFWNSAETYVFSDFDRAIKFLKVYTGDFEKEVRSFLNELQEERLYGAVRECFLYTGDLGGDSYPDFMNDLKEFVLSHEASMKDVLVSMKLYLLNYYRTELENSGRFS